jgi:hypothetical protein
MMKANTAHLGAALAVATPWIVLRIAEAVALRHARAGELRVSPARPTIRLGRATAAAALLVVGFAVLFPARPGWLAILSLALFAALSIFALRALGELDAATWNARHLDSATRTASLVARRHRDYLASHWRILLLALSACGFATFAWRVTVPSNVDRRLFLPILFALAASIFLWLYEAWIHQLVTGPLQPDSPDSSDARRRSIRFVFTMELVLVTGFLAVGHALLDLDWVANGGWGAVVAAAGGLLGVVGCALALSSDLAVRRHRVQGEQGRR